MKTLRSQATRTRHLAILFMLVLASCTSMKRFRTASYGGEDLSLVEVDLFSAILETPDPPVSRNNLWDLDAGAQTRLIQILDARYPENDRFQHALTTTYFLETGGTGAGSLESDLRMVFSVRKHRDYPRLGEVQGRFTPADRIEYLRISLKLPEESPVKFKAWNRYSTEYADLVIGDVSFSRSLELDAQGEAELAEGGVRIHSGRKEDQSVRARHMVLNGKLSPSQILLEEQGNRETDLAGNILADITVEFEGFPEKIAVPVFHSEGENGLPGLSGLELVDLLVPRMEQAPGTLFASLEYEFVYRHVKSGWKTFHEWDDHVAYFSGKGTRKVPLLKKTDYAPRVYGIGTVTGSGPAPQEVLRFRDPAGNEYPLRFTDLIGAGKFCDWLHNKAGSVSEEEARPVETGDKVILWGSEALMWNEVPERSLQVFVVY